VSGANQGKLGSELISSAPRGRQEVVEIIAWRREL
jgi:hypothetical protein